MSKIATPTALLIKQKMARLAGLLGASFLPERNGVMSQERILWTGLQDTPFSKGEIDLCGWNSKEECDHGKLAWNNEEEEDDEEEEEKKTICSACKRDFTDEVDDRSSFDEIGKIICKDCFEEEEEEEQIMEYGKSIIARTITALVGDGFDKETVKAKIIDIINKFGAEEEEEEEEEEELICKLENGGGCGAKGWKLDSGAIQFGCECGAEEEEEVCDDCGEEDCSMDGLCCPEAIERTEKEMCV